MFYTDCVNKKLKTLLILLLLCLQRSMHTFIRPGSNRKGEGLASNEDLLCARASHVAQMVKNPPAMWETWVGSLGWGDPPEKGKATHSSILAWRIPWTIQSMGSQRVGHD